MMIPATKLSLEEHLGEVVDGGICSQATLCVLETLVMLDGDGGMSVDATVASIGEAREAVDETVALLSDGGDDGRLRALLALRLAVDDAVVKLREPATPPS